jgi:quinol monooxygenase YgiN
MVCFVVRFRFSPEDHQRVSDVLRPLALASRQEPGCVAYVPGFLDGDADTVLIYEQYVDEAALEAHRATEHFKQYAIGGLYQLMKERSIENMDAIV